MQWNRQSQHKVDETESRTCKPIACLRTAALGPKMAAKWTDLS